MTIPGDTLRAGDVYAAQPPAHFIFNIASFCYESFIFDEIRFDFSKYLSPFIFIDTSESDGLSNLLGLTVLVFLSQIAQLAAQLVERQLGRASAGKSSMDSDGVRTAARWNVWYAIDPVNKHVTSILAPRGNYSKFLASEMTA